MKHCLYLVLFLACGVSEVSGQEKLNIDNYWVKNLGLNLNRSRIIDAHKENGAEVKSVDKGDNFIAFYPRSGMAIEFYGNRVNNQANPKQVFWGTAKEFKFRYQTLKTNEPIQSHRGKGIFGFEIGMRLSDIEARLGQKLKLSHNEEENYDVRRFPWLPIVGGMDLHLFFTDGRISAIRASVNRYFNYQRNIKNVKYLSSLGYPQILEKLLKLESKITYGDLNIATNGLTIQRDPMSANTLKILIGSDHVYLEPNQRTSLVWCMDSIGTEKEIRDYLLGNLRVLQNQDIEPFNRTKEVQLNLLESLFVDNNDEKTYEDKNTKYMYHLYQLEGSHEVVLDIINPGSHGTKAKFFNSCKLENPKKVLDDEALVNEAIKLKDKFGSVPGIDWFAFIGGSSYDQINGRGPRGTGLYPTSHENRVFQKLYTSHLSFKLDQKQASFRGTVPFGLKKNMKMEAVQKIIPQFKFDSDDTKKKTETIYTNVPWSENISLSISCQFEKNKLKRVGISVNKPLHREWQKLKEMVLIEGS